MNEHQVNALMKRFLPGAKTSMASDREIVVIVETDAIKDYGDQFPLLDQITMFKQAGFNLATDWKVTNASDRFSVVVFNSADDADSDWRDTIEVPRKSTTPKESLTDFLINL